MAIYEYDALAANDRLMCGTIEAASPAEAEQLLKDMKLTVNSIEKAKLKGPKTSISRDEFLLFNQQLASITKAGVPLERGLRELSADIGSRKMRKLVEDIASELERGESIEKAFEKRQKYFPPLYGRILKAGVETGRLSQMLTNLNRHIEMSNQTRKIIFEAIAYPAVIFAMASVIITFMFLLVIPQFSNILQDMTGGQLPSLTRVVLKIPKYVIPFWIGVGILTGLIITLNVLVSPNSAIRKMKESVLLSIPVLGRLYHSSIMAKMAESMAAMIAAGTDMSSCLRLSAESSGSQNLIFETKFLAEQIEKGTNIMQAGQFCRIIPKLFLYSIQLGSQRNELEDNLHSLGQMYVEQVRCSQARLEAILLPLMLMVVGGLVGMIVLSIFLPMCRIITSLM
ncbi:MAG: type II secretion system F family protein [Planctomycetaceae bacterium]|nr:type II secretion system F family protein [Planctomycetaceae bacterium]